MAEVVVRSLSSDSGVELPGTRALGPRVSPNEPGMPSGLSLPGSVLVAGVGYRNLRDLSVGPMLIERLQARVWPSGVQVEDLSFGAVHVVHWLQDAQPFSAALFLGASQRGREPGTLERIEWQSTPVTDAEVQTRVGEAVTGVISLDTLLIVLEHFKVLPPRVVCYEIEPVDTDWGEQFSLPVQEAMGALEKLLIADVKALAA